MAPRLRPLVNLMWRHALILSLTLALAGLAGCAEQEPERIGGLPPFYVPYSVGSRGYPRQLAAGTPAHVLQLPGGEDVMFGRAEHGYDGPLELDRASAFTEFTFDSMPVGLGYQYRYLYRSGVTVP